MPRSRWLLSAAVLAHAAGLALVCVGFFLTRLQLTDVSSAHDFAELPGPSGQRYSKVWFGKLITPLRWSAQARRV